MSMSHAEDTLIQALTAWQRGEGSRNTLIAHLTALRPEQGETVRGVIGHLLGQAPASQSGGGTGQMSGDPATDSWRRELLACRARTWAAPQSAGLLVGPSVLILTDGQRGVLLREGGVRRLPGSTGASLMLLCQTIVLADDALDARELRHLREQRTESASTSLSEIEVIRDAPGS